MDDRNFIARERMDCALLVNTAGRIPLWHLYRAAWLRVEAESDDAGVPESCFRELITFAAECAEKDVLSALALFHHNATHER